MTGKTTGVTGAATGKTVVPGPGCSGDHELDVQGGHAAARSAPWRLQTRRCHAGVPGGVAMAVKTEGRGRQPRAGLAVRGPGRGAAESRGPGGPGEGCPGAWRRWSRMRSSSRTGRGIRSGCCWGRRSRGCRSWCRSGTGGCWCRRSRSTGVLRCRWPRTWPARPSSGLRVQLCGDAHLSNFGAFASPERRLVFDVNDFDETLPGPFEWDVKRLAASLAVAGRDNGFPAKARRKIVLAAAEGYRTAMRGFARAAAAGGLVRAPGHRAGHRRVPVPGQGEKVQGRRGLLAKAHTRDSMQALGKLTTVVDGQRRIISDPPMIVPIEEVFADMQADAVYEQLRAVLGKYRRTLQSDRRHLLEQFTLVQVARKVVGVGSVGTRAWILLMDAGDGVEPLFLQAKEAQPSVLADYCGRSEYTNQGERVVAGQHLMQAQSDIFLGWTRAHRPRRGRARLLRAPAAGLEVLGADRADDPRGHDGLRPAVRVDPGPGARPLR